ncbi:acyl carrier protein [candidate division KSB1 bacterium]|nr:MAG: acyl carrier protein [candidate division KSB1 bacterium]
MEKKHFIELLKETLEIDESVQIDENTMLTDLEEYDSLSTLGIIALIDEHFGKKLSGEDLQNITTVKSLMEMIGEDQFK